MNYLNAISFRIAILAASMVAPALGAQAAEVRLRADIQIRDPFILPVPETQTYYMVDKMAVRLKDGSTRQGVGVYTSKDLERWEGPKPVFHCPDGFWADGDVWAPEMHRYRDKYYVFATFNSKGGKTKRATQILVSDSPEGPFKPFANKPHTPEDWLSLDGTLWVEDGVPYMVFCHEWVQVTDGTMELVRLKDDLSDVVGEPQTLFKASEAKWARPHPTKTSYVTDGPFLYRTKTGRLLMIWSSFGEERKYMVGVAYSISGKVAGPWKQMDEPLLAIDGGHGMIFKTFDGRLVMPIHQPNQGKIRARLFEVEDVGDTLRIQREIPLEEARSSEDTILHSARGGGVKLAAISGDRGGSGAGGDPSSRAYRSAMGRGAVSAAAGEAPGSARASGPGIHVSPPWPTPHGGEKIECPLFSQRMGPS